MPKGVYTRRPRPRLEVYSRGEKVGFLLYPEDATALLRCERIDTVALNQGPVLWRASADRAASLEDITATIKTRMEAADRAKDARGAHAAIAALNRKH